MLLISTATASAYELNCDAPQVAIGDDLRDNNPVVSVGIRYIPDDHQWRVFHYLSNGLHSGCEDGANHGLIAGTDWCLVTWNGLTCWVSQVGLLPIGEPVATL